ncbi:fas-binding factor 1 homolog isoform X3 [Genypterus blacodes]|uniref:fas-binding factor 1 homolog isoform X3 n=1 Tax=Genypterus blacodes TaxID=154954 RepID=UPI003F769634
MASKPKGKLLKSSHEDDDILDSLLDESKFQANRRSSRSGPVNRSSVSDNFFSMLAEEVKGDGEDSDVSDADPDDILKTIKDLDSMESDVGLFGSKKKPSSAPAQTKVFGKNEPKKVSTTLESHVKADTRDELSGGGRKPNSAPSSIPHGYKKSTLPDLDDPFDDVLDDLLPEETKAESKTRRQEAKPEKTVLSPSLSPVIKKETAKVPKKQNEITFDDEKDDLMDALGFNSNKDSSKKKEVVLRSNKESDAPQRARTRLDEILERGTSPHLLERPPTGEKNEPQSVDKLPQEKPTSAKDEDLTFGAYQPTLGSTPEGHQSRRQSVRFSTEDVSATSLEKKSKPIAPATPTTPTSTRQRNSADWLGLKTNDTLAYLEDDAKQPEPSSESLKTLSSPVIERKPSVTGSRATPAAKTTAEASAPSGSLTKAAVPEFPASQSTEEDTGDWLAGVLSKKKAQTLPPSEPLSLGEEVNLESFVSKQPPKSRQDTLASIKEASDTSLGQRSSTPSNPVQDERIKPDTTPTSLSALPQLPSISTAQHRIQSTPADLQQQVTLSADYLQQLLLQQQMMQSQLLGGVLDAGSLQRLKEKAQHSGDHQAVHPRIIQLEGQVKTLQLEREQSQVLLESVKQGHKQDMELIENAHKACVKLLEESTAQKETRARQECEDLMERLATVTRLAEQERAELQAQYQRKLAQAQQDRDREVERLRDLQRKSILEMKKDHEEQIQRLKRLKEEEIDAVTSATSQTRSLTVAIEQMEQFSTRLGELSSRVESTHEHTSHSLEQGARHRDEQLRMMQDRLAQQQRGMVDERAHLKEIIARMDAQLTEQQRQLEKERWRMTAEQAKAESTQRGLEEERRSFSVQINMEREELERAKTALLEEQQSVMQHCAEERRKLATEVAHFHTQEKQRLERAEREASRALERDAHREGSIISLALEQADLKLRAAELKQKEMAVAQEREAVESQKEELDKEKQRLSGTALRLKTRAQEVEAFSKLATEKYEEGEGALQEARHVATDHEMRLRSIHSQMERLRQQEQRLHQERMRKTHLQKETDRLKLPITPLSKLIPPISPDLGPVVPNPDVLASILNSSPPVSFGPRSTELQASLALLKYTAEKDHDYLQDEQFFLTTLKKSSYSPAFHPH